MKLFRLLRADEIEARIQSVQKNGCVVLLYKDARCDMNILDETFGASNWQRNHEIIDGNLYCNVGIKFENEWIWKQDVGTESNTEKEKGQASDSFKRACFNWGIGRELYTSPFIWIALDEKEIVNGKCYTKFFVKEIEYNDKEEISKVVIVDDKGKQRFPKVEGETKKEPTKKPKTSPKPQEQGASVPRVDYKALVQQYIEENGFDKLAFCQQHQLNSKSSQEQFKAVWEVVSNGTGR